VGPVAGRAGVPDGGAGPQAGVPDSGVPDSGPGPQAGVPDGGAGPQAGAPDSGVPDSGVPDGGAGPQAGVPDSGAGPQAGAPDGGAGPVKEPPAPTVRNRISAAVNQILPIKLKSDPDFSIHGPDIMRSGIGIGPGILSYIINYKAAPFPMIPGVNTVPAMPGVAPTNVPPPPPPPPHIGGGTYTVKPGDNLWNIAKDRLHNPDLYPLIEAANPGKIGPNGLILPGEVLKIPSLPPPPPPPPPPPNSVSYVVRPGDSVWEISGGNAKLMQQIIKLNHLKDPSLILPGQVLFIPSAG